MAKAMVSTVRPKARATPRYPMPTLGTPAASTAEPHPPKTSQKVPKNSAAARLPMGMEDLLDSDSGMLACGPKIFRGGSVPQNCRNQKLAEASSVTPAFSASRSRLSVPAGDARLETSGFRVRQSVEIGSFGTQPVGAVAAVGLGGRLGEIPAGPGGPGTCLWCGAVFHGLARRRKCMGHRDSGFDFAGAGRARR